MAYFHPKLIIPSIVRLSLADHAKSYTTHRLQCIRHFKVGDILIVLLFFSLFFSFSLSSILSLFFSFFSLFFLCFFSFFLSF